jgi:peptide-methionine (R)-S-oxide reductase
MILGQEYGFPGPHLGQAGQQSSFRHREGESMNTIHPAPISRRSILISSGSALAVIALAPLHPALAASAADAPSEGPVTVVQFSPDGKKIGKVKLPRIIKSDAEWQQQLPPISFEVSRHAATEKPYTGSTWDLHDRGIFHCVCCELPVFSSETKFESGTGWPSFWQPIARENVVESKDTSGGMARTAVTCRLCSAHLGHVFDDGPRPTGQRYCMNSAAMHFVKQA